jgi:hypothetical protein
MKMKNDGSSKEYLDLLSQICDASESFLDTSDSIDVTFTLYNLPFSDDTKQSMSFYYNRYGGDTSNSNSQYVELAKELSKLLLKSKPTTDPNALCIYTQWSGRAMGADHEYIGANEMIYPVSTYSEAYPGTYGDVVYTSDGTAMYVSRNGSIYSYNPCYRTFAPEDEARVLEILEQWRILNRTYYYTSDGVDDGEPSIGDVLQPLPTPTPAPYNAG